MNQKFLDYFKGIMGKEDFEAFITQVRSGNVKRALRVNTLLTKRGGKEIESEFGKLERLPWSDSGYFYNTHGATPRVKDLRGEIKEAEPTIKSIGNTSSFLQGKVYSQEASSQVAAVLLEPVQGDYILDMCASPGSKTTQIASLVKNNALIIANEVSPDRYIKLRNNLHHFGIVCHAVTALDTSYFARNYLNTFDKILVDAPCSGEGMYFKFPAVIDHWNLKTVKFNAKRQKRILLDAFLALKPGGRLVYSTCTLNLEENEKVVGGLLKKFFGNAEILNIDTKRLGFYRKGGKRKATEPMLKIWPHEFKTGGFFACVITKKLPTERLSPVHAVHLTARQKRQSVNKVIRKDVREGWNVCMRKETLSVLVRLAKEASGKSIDLPEHFAIVKKDREYYLQYHSFYKKFADLPVKSVGIKVLDNKNNATTEAAVWLRTLLN